VRGASILYNRAMRISCRELLALALACAGLALPARAAEEAASKRLALVIGNGAYADAPLANPLNDAADIAKALEASGFTVIRRENASLRDMHLALREFGDKLGRRDTGLFYFAGHGMQVRGHNYLLPVGADVAREDEVAFAALDLAAVMEKLDSAKNPVNIVILDACRNNPFGTRIAASAKGLAQVDAPPGTFIAFATAPGSTAADGGGRNGLYTQNLVRQMAKTGAPIEDVFQSVRAAVRAESKGMQIPWESTSLEARFAFREGAKPAPQVASAATSSRPSAPRAIPASLGSAPSFALGDGWAYKVTNLLDGSERRVAYHVTEVANDQVRYSNGSVSDLFGNSTRIPRSGGRVDEFNPSNQFYLFPLRPCATWDMKVLQTSGERKFDLEVNLKVIGEEEVETPAGRMRGLRIERVARWKQRDSPVAGVNTWTYWYNSGVKRIVAGEQKNVTASGKVLLHERYDLAAYQVR